MASFVNVARTTASTSEFILGMILNHQELGLIWKRTFNFECIKN